MKCHDEIDDWQMASWRGEKKGERQQVAALEGNNSYSQTSRTGAA